MYLYAGAHTLRWSSRILQVHNFIRGYDDPARIATILDAYRTGDAAFVRALFARPIWELSKCIRGFIAAPEGQELGVVDYSQIEARNLDWHADNEPGLEMWRDGSIDPYVRMAQHIFGKSYEEIKNQKSGEMRRIGKNTTLGAGFQMSAGAWLMYARKMGSKADEDLAELAIGTYREINKAVVDYWSDVQNHAIAAIAEPSRTIKLKRIAFEMVDHWLCVILPSGRRIWYPYAKLTTGKTKYGKTVEQIVFMITNAGQKMNKVDTVVFMLDNLHRQPHHPHTGDTLAVAHAALMAGDHNGMGNFMAAQVIADCKHTRLLSNAPDWWDWCAPGPGSQRGLSRLLGMGDEFQHFRADTFIEKLSQLRKEIQHEIKIKLCLQDLQSCLCEFDKFERTLWGEGRPRSRYKPPKETS